VREQVKGKDTNTGMKTTKRKILGPTDQHVQEHFHGLLRLAQEKGASDAKVIESKDILVDPRVRFKCMIPKCFASGTCRHCPPHGYSIEEIRKAVSGYDYAVFFRVVVDSTLIAGPEVAAGMNTGVLDDAGSLLNLGAHYILVFQIVAFLERKARSLGYTPRGFAAGTCRDALCHFQPYCQALMTDKGCRHPDISRPSMESCGMDVYAMAANVGWDMYPIGGTCGPEDVPKGSLMGLVLVA